MRLCDLEDCNDKHYGKGFCKFHYKRHYEGRSLTAKRLVRDKDRGCGVEDCNRPYNNNGYCEMHAYRVKHNIPLDKPVRGTLVECEIEGCIKPARCKKLCVTHYRSSEEALARKRWSQSKRRSYQSISAELFSIEINQFSELYWNSLYGQPCYMCKEATADCVDHIVPLSEGGYHVWWNFAPICRPCNSSKNNKHLINL